MVKKFQNIDVRIVLKGGVEWFRASDVCESIEIANTFQAIKTIDKDDLCLVEVIDTIGRRQDVYFVNEAGLYALFFKSKSDKAKAFKRWVFSEVLPSIRKTGQYSIPQALRDKSTKARNSLTDRWKENGVSEPKEYGMLTLEEYKLLRFEKGKRKPDLSRRQLMALEALESLEALSLEYNPVEGYLECKQSLTTTSKKVLEITEKGGPNEGTY